MSTGSLICGKWLIGKEPLIFVIEKVRDMILVLFLSKTALTAVSADVLTAAGEFVDGQDGSCWYIRWQFAMEVVYCEAVDLIDGKHGSLFHPPDSAPLRSEQHRRHP